jgi:hypothetical protein
MDHASSPSRPAHGSRFATHFLESVLLTWLSNFVRIVIGLVALRLVTGAIAEEALGAYWILTSVSALLANFADLGVGLSAVRHLPVAPSPDHALFEMWRAAVLQTPNAGAIVRS